MIDKRYIAIIPARYASTRFPAKPLAVLGGKPIIQRVYERVKPFFEETIGLFENYKWTGLFGLSANTIPGSKGTISRQMYEQYIDKGWETCLYWDGNSDLSVFLEDMTNRLEKQGFEFPSTLVLDSADYPQDYDELAKKYEFKTSMIISLKTMSSWLSSRAVFSASHVPTMSRTPMSIRRTPRPF